MDNRIDIAGLIPNFAEDEKKEVEPLKPVDGNLNSEQTNEINLNNDFLLTNREYEKLNYNNNALNKTNTSEYLIDLGQTDYKQEKEVRNSENKDNLTINDLLNQFNQTDEEKKLLNEFKTQSSIVSNNINKYVYILEQKERVMVNLNNISKAYNQAREDRQNLNIAITALKQWYNRYKEDIINNLQANINEMLNGFFGDNHRIRLIQNIQRNNSVVTMEEVDSMGNKLGDIGVRLSGAQKQLVGFLIQASILSTLGSDFMVLDETFSSFGNEEIKKIPKILENLEDIQIICIEHKDDMFKELPIRTIELGRDLEQGTYIKNIVEAEEV